MNNIIRLHKLFNESGIKGRPISDQELKVLKTLFDELADYMDWRGDKTMAHSFRVENQGVQRMIDARKN
jgi:hypothetical protein